MSENGTEIQIHPPPPQGSFMLQEYPELKEKPELNSLRDYELRFVWYFANPTSPIIDCTMSDRAVKAVQFAFLDDAVSEAERNTFITGKFTDKIRAAINVMKAFNPQVRMRAKMNAEHIFRNIEKIIHVDKVKMKMMGFADKKQYAEMSMKVMAQMPELINIMERGFGVYEVPKKKMKTQEEESLGSPEQTIKSLDKN